MSKPEKWERDSKGKRVKRLHSIRRFKAGYELRKVEYANAQYGGTGTMMHTLAYTPEGNYIGNSKEAHYLCVKRGLSEIQLSDKENSVCSIGFDAVKKRWAGWSHRAICSFGIGDMLFKERFKGATDKTPFLKHGTVKIKTMAQAKLAAKRFANSVS